jgi:hypothetical protein
MLIPVFIRGFTPSAPTLQLGQQQESPDGALNPRNRTLLTITDADEAPIAAPAISGVENPAAASGIAATL